MPAQCWPTACNGAVTLVQPRPSIVSQRMSTRRKILMLGKFRKQWPNIKLPVCQPVGYLYFQ